MTKEQLEYMIKALYEFVIRVASEGDKTPEETKILPEIISLLINNCAIYAASGAKSRSWYSDEN